MTKDTPPPPPGDQPSRARRRVPRRSFAGAVGVLLHGKYEIERAFQVGEGGMMISSRRPIKEGSYLSVSFFLNSRTLVMVRGVIRSVVSATSRFPVRYGVEFENLHFQHKREIRNYVAAATRSEGEGQMPF